MKKNNDNNTLYRFGPYELFPRERRLLRAGVAVPVTAKSSALLQALLEQAGRVVTREQLIATLWPNTVVEEQNLTWNVSTLRKLLGDEGDTPTYIETVRGLGYRFVAPVSVEQEPEAEPDSPSNTETAPAHSPPADKPGPWRPLHTALAAAAVLVILAVAGLLWKHHADSSQGIRSIAVLPFENLSASPDNAYFADGIQDTILTKLAAISSLRVISRTSTERYPSHPENIRTIAAELGVNAILEGSVQKSGNEVLINAQLIDARTDEHLWAQVYKRTLDNVFEVESDVADQVAGALRAHLLPTEQAQLAQAPTQNSRAYDLFLRAEYMATQIEEGLSRTPVATVDEGTDLYRRALKEDPAFALAAARLSYLESYAYWFDLDHTPARIAGAEAAAKRALELDPQLWQAHLAMGYVHYWGYRDYDAAFAEFERAREGMPNNADVIAAIAYIQRRHGQWDAAVEGLERAATLDPRNPRWFLSIGDTMTDLRRYDDAVKAYDHALSIEPDDYNTKGRRIWALIGDGRIAAAQQALDAIPPDVDPEGVISTLRFEVARLSRRPADAIAALANAPTLVQTPLAVGEVPVDLLRAQAWEESGDSARSIEAYSNARRVLMDALGKQPDNPDLLAQLALAEAGLGDQANAMQHARQATERLPVSKDALYGLAYQNTLARVCAHFGDAEAALPILRDLLQRPAGVYLSPWLLAHDPQWDRIRSATGFAALAPSR